MSKTLVLLPMADPNSPSRLPAITQALGDRLALDGKAGVDVELIVAAYGFDAERVAEGLPADTPLLGLAIGWERAINLMWKSCDQEEFESVILLHEDAELARGWVDGLLSGLKPEAVLLQGSAASDELPAPGQEYGKIGMVGPVSDQTVNPAQKIALRAQDVALGLGGYSGARLDALAGSFSSAEWLDLTWLLMTKECATAVAGDGDLLDPGCGDWAGADLAVRSANLGYSAVVAEAVFASRSRPVLDSRESPGDVSGRLAFYDKHRAVTQAAGTRVVACFRVTLRSYQDLQTWRGNLGRTASLVDAMAIMIVNNPLEIQGDPEFLAAVKSGRLSPDDRALLEACSQANARSAKMAIADWVSKVVPSASIFVTVWKGKPDLYRQRNHLYRYAETKLGADWILALEHDEIVEPRVDRNLIERLVSHPNPLVRGYDFGFVYHWDSARLVREDAPWGDGGEYTGGPHGVRLWRACPSGSPRRLASSTRRVSPEIGPDGFRVAGVRIRRFAVMREEDRAKRLKRSHQEGMKISAFQKRTGIGMHMLVYERENPEDVARWLDDLHGLCDEIVLVWTGWWDADDAESGPGRALTMIGMVHQVTWVHQPLDDNLAQARNAGISKLGESSRLGWALFFDPDEWLTDRVTEGAMLRRMADADKWGWLVQTANYRQGNESPTISDSVRMSRLEATELMRMNGRVHESFSDAIHAIQNLGEHPRLRYAPFVLQHRGMAFDEERMGEKLDHYERLLRLDLDEDPHNPGAWVSLGWHYANDGHQELAVECYERGISCAGQSYLPFKELAFVHLRLARELMAQSHDRLTEAHQFYALASTIRNFLDGHAPPHPVIPRSGLAEPLPLPDFTPPGYDGA